MVFVLCSFNLRYFQTQEPVELQASLETQGQLVGVRESLNGQKNMAQRKVKNSEKSPW